MIVTTLQNFLSSYIPVSSCSDSVEFIRAGSKAPRKKKEFTGILHKACNWKLSFDSEDNNLVVPPYLAVTSLRPDLLLLSKQSKKVILIELTYPCEENMEARHHDKLHNYALQLR